MRILFSTQVPLLGAAADVQFPEVGEGRELYGIRDIARAYGREYNDLIATFRQLEQGTNYRCFFRTTLSFP